MAQTTIEQFATELKMPSGALLEQLAKAGVARKKEGGGLLTLAIALFAPRRERHTCATVKKKSPYAAEVLRLGIGTHCSNWLEVWR